MPITITDAIQEARRRREAARRSTQFKSVCTRRNQRKLAKRRATNVYIIFLHSKIIILFVFTLDLGVTLTDLTQIFDVRDLRFNYKLRDSQRPVTLT